MNGFDDSAPIRKTGDAILIKKFVDGETALLSNQNLRVESTFDSTQLIAKKEGVIAVIKRSEQTILTSVRRQSQYTSLLHEALLKKNYVPLNFNNKENFINYSKHEIPAGYQFNFTESRFLWKEWWIRSRKYSTQRIQLELLVFTRDKWYPIREVVSSQGMVFVTTLVGETHLQGSDYVAWLSRFDQSLQPNYGDLSAGEEKRLPDTNLPTSSIKPDQRRPPGMPGHHTIGTPPRPSFPYRRVADSLSSEAVGVPAPPAPPSWTSPEQHAPTSPPLDQEATTVQSPIDFNEYQELGHVDNVVDTSYGSQSPSQGNSQIGMAEFIQIGSVLKFGQGRLYIRTALGDIVIEGTDLKFWLTKLDNW